MTFPRLEVNNPTPPSRTTPKIAGIYLYMKNEIFVSGLSGREEKEMFTVV
tara:strand:- start:195 stop:344 length:150 start_codon:yes stop_codon:yes gene_type:complete